MPRPGVIEIIYDPDSEIPEFSFVNGTRWVIDLKSIGTPANVSQPSSNGVTVVDFEELPSVNEVTEYLLSKEGCEFDSAELHDRFIGRILKSRDEPQLYNRFARIIREAQDEVESRLGAGEWIEQGFRSLGGRSRAKVFKFKQSLPTEERTQDSQPSDEINSWI
jgi:hypothetical protein